MKQVAPNIWQHTAEGKTVYYRGDHKNFEGPYDSVESALGNTVEASAVVKPIAKENNDEDNQDTERSEESEG